MLPRGIRIICTILHLFLGLDLYYADPYTTSHNSRWGPTVDDLDPDLSDLSEELDDLDHDLYLVYLSDKGDD